MDVREAVLQVLPGMRKLANAVNSIRFSLSMNLLTPVFGMRGKAYHTALRDCEAEAVVVTAFIRYIARQQPSTAKSKPKKMAKKKASPPLLASSPASDEDLDSLLIDSPEAKPSAPRRRLYKHKDARL